MRCKLCVLIVLAGAACGTGQKSVRVDDSRLVRLSSESKQELIDQERDVGVAEANLDAARVAEKEARAFASIVDSERKGARAQHEAAKKSVKLGVSSRDAPTTSAGADQLVAAEAHVATLDAKASYAKDLVAHRSAIVAQREAELAAARAELEAAKVALLEEEGQSAGLDRERFDQSAAQARKRATELRARALDKQAHAEERRAAWQTLRRKDVARGQSDSGAVDAPPPPEPIETPLR